MPASASSSPCSPESWIPKLHGASDFSQTLRLFRTAAEERHRIHQIRTEIETSRR